MKKLLFLSALLSSTCLAESGITMTVKTDDANGLAHHEILCKSQHSVQFINDSDYPKDYVYKFDLCVSNHGCQTRGKMITVQPHKSWSYTTEMQHQTGYKYDGAYQITATTTVNGTVVIDKAVLSARP